MLTLPSAKCMAEVPEIRLAGLAYRLPFAHLFRPHTATERAALRGDIAELGVLGRVVTYDSDTYGQRCVIDGGTRIQIASELGKAVPVHHRGRISDARAEREAVSLNTARRHLSPEEQEAYRKQRNADIVQDRLEGDSLGVIADRFGLSRKAVFEIVEAAGVTQVTPDRVTGKDGKSYPATTSAPVPTASPAEPQRTTERTPEYYLDSARRGVVRVRTAFDELLASRYADRLRVICERHHFNPATLDAILADLAAEAVQVGVVEDGVE